MIYELGDTNVVVIIEPEYDNGHPIWVCTAFVGNSQLVQTTTSRNNEDFINDIEFEFMRFVVYTLINASSKMLWGKFDNELIL
jgi:hypothetical protein